MKLTECMAILIEANRRRKAYFGVPSSILTRSRADPVLASNAEEALKILDEDSTANRRTSATIAFFIPRGLAIFIAQALSQDHFAERTNMTWAAS